MANKKDGFGREILGTIGDVNPLDHAGGIVVSRSARGYGPELEYTRGLEGLGGDVPDDESAAMLEVYRVQIDEDLLREYDWVTWTDVANSIGMDVDELLGYAREDNVMARASVIEAIADYYGWGELDAYPMTLSYAELEVRWDPGEAVKPDKYDAMVARPGKFQGEPSWVPYFYEEKDGWADEEDSYPDGGGWLGKFNLTERDRVGFPDLEGVDVIGIYERSDGFVVGVDEADVDRILEDMAAANEKDDED